MSLAIGRIKSIGDVTNVFYDLELGLKQPFLTCRNRVGSFLGRITYQLGNKKIGTSKSHRNIFRGK